MSPERRQPVRVPAGGLPFGLAAGAAAAGVAAGTITGITRRRRRRPDGVAVARGVATTDGLRLHTTVRGPDDAPAAVVLCHGWTMSGEFWTTHAEALARRGLHTVTFDQRGHGRSGRPRANGFELDDLGDDLAAVLDDTVPTDMPVVLVGHSMGAMSIMAWAGRETPTRHQVVGAVLANTAAHQVVPEALTAITTTANPVVHAGLRHVLKVPVPIPPGPITRSAVRMIALGEDPPASAVDTTYRLFMATSSRTRIGFAHELDALDLREGLGRLTMPTLVVTGTRDLLTPPSHARSLTELLPDARLQILPGAGHQLPIEYTAEFIDLVHAHVRHTAGAGPRGGEATSSPLPAVS